MITLAKTALLCSRQPSDLVGIDEREVAFAFNVECADILNQWEMEREFEKEKRQIELLTGQKLASTLGGRVPQQQNNIERW